MKKYSWLLFAMLCMFAAQAQNHKPSATIDIYVGLEDLPLPLFPLNNDSDPDSGDVLNWRPVTGPFNGYLDTIFGQTVYRGNPDYFGSDFIFYRVCDNGTPVKCALSTIYINIQNINDAPDAQNDTFNINEDVTSTFNVLLNDKDVDHDPLHISAINQGPTHGTATIVNNKIVYVPNANYSGTDQLRYRVCDTSSGILPGCDNARVTIYIHPINDAPVAVNDTLFDDLSDSTTTVVNLLNNDTDIEHDSLYVTGLITGSGLSATADFSLDSAGNLSVVSSTQCGIDSLWYIVCDASKCDTGMIYISLTCPDIPIDTTGESLFLPQGFSPDGDGVNDLLVFPNIDQLKPLGLRIFNRYGDPVYQNDDYQNDWNGIEQHKGNPLPDGTYFYTLRLKNGKEKVNYLVIQR